MKGQVESKWLLEASWKAKWSTSGASEGAFEGEGLQKEPSRALRRRYEGLQKEPSRAKAFRRSLQKEPSRAKAFRRRALQVHLKSKCT